MRQREEVKYQECDCWTIDQDSLLSAAEKVEKKADTVEQEEVNTNSGAGKT